MRLEMQGLVHEYPSGGRALDGIDLVIDGDEPVAIIGQNGAGKTTLVKHFNGILRPTAGRMLIDGADVNERSTAEWSAKVGYVFQNPDDQLFLESVRKEFAFGPTQIGLDPALIEERIEQVAALVGLRRKLDTHPFDLTPTEKKFCAIGAIVMMDPQALVFDEPTCGQDMRGNARLRRLIEALRAEGKLCVTISHDMKFVTENFSRVIVMCAGRVLLDGPACEVFARTDVLRRSFVAPPPITRVAQGAGLPGTPFHVPAFIKAFDQAVDHMAAPDEAPGRTGDQAGGESHGTNHTTTGADEDPDKERNRRG